MSENLAKTDGGVLSILPPIRSASLQILTACRDILLHVRKSGKKTDGGVLSLRAADKKRVPTVVYIEGDFSGYRHKNEATIGDKERQEQQNRVRGNTPVFFAAEVCKGRAQHNNHQARSG